MKSNSEEQKTAKIIAEMAQRRAKRERVNEGPAAWMAGAKAGGKALSNAWGKAKAGYQQQTGVDSQDGVIKANIQQWNQLVGQQQAAGQPATIDQLKQFLQKKFPLTPAQIPPGMDINDPSQIKDVISKVAHQNQVNGQLGGGQAAKAETPTAATAAPAAQAPAAAKSEPIKIGGQTLDPKNPADAKMIAQIQAQDAGGGQATQPAATPRTATPTASQVLSSFRSLEPDEQEMVRAQLTKGAAPAAAPAAQAQANMAANAATPAPAAPETPAPAAEPATKPEPNFGGAYAPANYNGAPTSNMPTTPPRTTKPRPTAPQLSAAKPQLGPTVNAGKINNKPSLAEFKKLKSKLVVKEMALAKLKRVKGII